MIILFTSNIDIIYHCSYNVNSFFLFFFHLSNYSQPIRKTTLSWLAFCSCGYFANEIFINLLIHESMLRRFMKIALALNRLLI